MSKNKQWRPGETVPQSATYVAFDAQGHNGGSLYLEKGKRFPATQSSGSYYCLGEQPSILHQQGKDRVDA